MAIDDFLLNSDYPLDKVVFIKEDSMVVPDDTYNGIFTITHNLPFMVLPILLWSETSDFETTYTLGDTGFNSGEVDGSFYPIGQAYYPLGDSPDLTIIQFNNSGSSKTIYYRLICLPPSSENDSSTLVPFTAVDADPFTLNTDQNYMKLIRAGSLTVADNTYTHDLGYVPAIRVWGVGAGSADPNIDTVIFPSAPLATSGVYVTSTQIIWENPNTFDSVEYRIYGEGGSA